MKRILAFILSAAVMVALGATVLGNAAGGGSTGAYCLGYSTANGFNTDSLELNAGPGQAVALDILIDAGTQGYQRADRAGIAQDNVRAGGVAKSEQSALVFSADDLSIKYRADGSAYVEVKFGRYYTGGDSLPYSIVLYLGRDGSRVDGSEFQLYGTYANDNEDDREPNTIVGGMPGSSDGSGFSTNKTGGGRDYADINPENRTSNAAWNTGSNVGTDGKVVQKRILSELERELAANNAKAVVRTRGASSISAATLRGIAYGANNAGKPVMLYADTIDEAGKIQGRMYVDPTKFSGREDDLLLGVYTNSKKTSPVKNKFENVFSNTVTVVCMEQQGSIGATVQVAARINYNGLNKNNLVFYTYSRSTNSYDLMENVSWRVDENDYLRFTTDQGGYIVITDKPLERK